MIEAATLEDAFPPSDAPNVKAHDVAYSILESPHKNIVYTDLTGRLPYRSSSGNEYILVGYHLDTNAVLVDPVKTGLDFNLRKGDGISCAQHKWKNRNY